MAALAVGAVACLGLGLFAAASMAAVAPYGGPLRYPYLCNPALSTHAPGEAAAWPGSDCCVKTFGPGTGPNWSCADTDAATDWHNILLLVTDDQAYCQYGFMAGVCSRPRDLGGGQTEWVSCTAELDCRQACVAHNGARACATDLTRACMVDADCTTPPDAPPDLGSCVATADLGTCTGSGASCAHTGECPSPQTCDKAAPPTNPDPPLRLNERACRNRQPQRRDTDHPYCSGSILDKTHLQHDRANAPCTDTPIEARPGLRTPHLDALAAEGVVFPRAYAAGVRCNSSRRAMMHGRYQRHLQYFFEGSGPGERECHRGGSDLANRGRGCDVTDGSTECEPTGECEQAYTIGRWGKEAQAASGSPPLDTASVCQGPAGAKTCVVTGAACTDDDDCPGPYVSYAFGKTESFTSGKGGFDSNWSDTKSGMGKIECTEKNVAEAACLDALDDRGAPPAEDPAGGELRYGDRPHFQNPYLQAFFDVPGPSLYQLTHAIDGRDPEPAQGGPVMVQPSGTYWVQRRPFFIWFGPELPHAGPTPDLLLQHLYDPAPGDGQAPYEGEEFEHYARVSWLDAAIGGVRYHLKRACTCARDGSIRSLYDNTVLIVLTDHGFLPYKSKGTPTEDCQRTPLVISAPADRNDADLTLADRVFWDEVPNAIDLLPAILEYSETTTGQDRRWFAASQALEEDYPHGRPLRTLITDLRNGALPASRRQLIFGEKSESGANNNYNPDSGLPRYVLNRPGLFGVCTTAFVNGAYSHVHPCLSDADCTAQTPSLGSCVCPPGSAPGCTTNEPNDGKWKRCENRPWKRCATDSNCQQPGFFGGADCLGGTCRTLTGSYKDFAGKTCTQQAQCFPPGVCAPLVLKAVADTSSGGNSTITRLYDLGWNPDETDVDQQGAPLQLLARLGLNYMTAGTGDLLERLAKCIDTFSFLRDRSTPSDGKNETWKDIENCPAPLGNWYQPQTAGLLWWDAP